MAGPEVLAVHPEAGFLTSGTRIRSRVVKRTARIMVTLLVAALVATSCAGPPQSTAGRSVAGAGPVGGSKLILALLQPQVRTYRLRARMTVTSLRAPAQAMGPATTYSVRAASLGGRVEVTRTGGGAARLWLGDGTFLARGRMAPGPGLAPLAATALEPAYFPHLAPLAGWATAVAVTLLASPPRLTAQTTLLGRPALELTFPALTWPDGGSARLWLDAATDLPLRFEATWRPLEATNGSPPERVDWRATSFAADSRVRGVTIPALAPPQATITARPRPVTPSQLGTAGFPVQVPHLPVPAVLRDITLAPRFVGPGGEAASAPTVTFSYVTSQGLAEIAETPDSAAVEDVLTQGLAQTTRSVLPAGRPARAWGAGDGGAQGAFFRYRGLVVDVTGIRTAMRWLPGVGALAAAVLARPLGSAGLGLKVPGLAPLLPVGAVGPFSAAQAVPAAGGVAWSAPPAGRWVRTDHGNRAFVPAAPTEIDWTPRPAGPSLAAGARVLLRLSPAREPVVVRMAGVGDWVVVETWDPAAAAGAFARRLLAVNVRTGQRRSLFATRPGALLNWGVTDGEVFAQDCPQDPTGASPRSFAFEVAAAATRPLNLPCLGGGFHLTAGWLTYFDHETHGVQLATGRPLPSPEALAALPDRAGGAQAWLASRGRGHTVWLVVARAQTSSGPVAVRWHTGEGPARFATLWPSADGPAILPLPDRDGGAVAAQVLALGKGAPWRIRLRLTPRP